MFELPDISHLFPAATRPKVAAKVLAKLLPTIEHAIGNGFTHAQVHAWLKQHGVVMQFRYYENALHRLRKQDRHAVRDTARALVPYGDSSIVGEKRAEDPVSLIPSLTETSISTSSTASGAGSEPLGNTSAVVPVGAPPDTSKLKTNDLSQAIASTPDERAGIISTQDAPPRKFRWDPMGAQKLSLTIAKG